MNNTIINTNINLNTLIESINTLIHSWGSDTPLEAIWGINSLAKSVIGEDCIQLSEEYSEAEYNIFLRQFQDLG